MVSVRRLAVGLLGSVIAASTAAAQSASSWIVDNHGRTAGTMEVRRTRDSMIVRHIYTDRNRGGRVETPWN